MKQYSAQQTCELLPFSPLVDALAIALKETVTEQIICPERLTVPATDGKGVLMTMPSVGHDLMVTKLLTIFGGNPALHLPAIQGQVICAEARSGRFLFSLDGPTVTMRRTSAVTMLGIRLLAGRKPQRVLIIGTGIQAVAHVQALSALYPGITAVIRGRSHERAAAFCTEHATSALDLRPEGAHEAPFDVVITVTSSTNVIYDQAPTPGCLVIGVGAYRTDMAEIGPLTINGSDLYVDDLVGAPSEAGDLHQAGVDWARVRSLATVLEGTPRDPARPVVFKSVGCSAWDLAACRVARMHGAA
ncbi:delta(1)-pyrroline-2-carboxylate reductase family protein [Komagataeibacter sp. FNDCF1]|uniref:delta(1)-pyrroline-2-carboxylate reductase family protein n=1 Tax=Komagataeibacter sp. FNDCF1 TaxID=2878681 RepID=UPI001E30FC60|nr:delta(1)-pyrroline-2-carboxylate reductase family protein [Komagataeibacter sp. FNDCF1]MCE2563293.1 delta(1)-pyrroline-2-carboxylate reductase family protein [Komagataeibacter sp. FNDCF1]